MTMKPNLTLLAVALAGTLASTTTLRAQEAATDDPK
jgi:hypothetical protein